MEGSERSLDGPYDRPILIPTRSILSAIFSPWNLHAISLCQGCYWGASARSIHDISISTKTHLPRVSLSTLLNYWCWQSSDFCFGNPILGSIRALSYHNFQSSGKWNNVALRNSKPFNFLNIDKVWWYDSTETCCKSYFYIVLQFFMLSSQKQDRNNVCFAASFHSHHFVGWEVSDSWKPKTIKRASTLLMPVHYIVSFSIRDSS